jgi:hypothetical protein
MDRTSQKVVINYQLALQRKVILLDKENKKNNLSIGEKLRF